MEEEEEEKAWKHRRAGRRGMFGVGGGSEVDEKVEEAWKHRRVGQRSMLGFNEVARCNDLNSLGSSVT